MNKSFSVDAKSWQNAISEAEDNYSTTFHDKIAISNTFGEYLGIWELKKRILIWNLTIKKRNGRKNQEELKQELNEIKNGI